MPLIKESLLELRVSHPHWGDGTVKEITDLNNGAFSAHVLFDQDGIVQTLFTGADFINLQILKQGLK